MFRRIGTHLAESDDDDDDDDNAVIERLCQIGQPSRATCIGSKFGHQAVSLPLQWYIALDHPICIASLY